MTSQRTRERLIQRLRDEGVRDDRVLDAIRNVPRHLFVDEALASRAYEDTALPIGFGQTISQPFIVAVMTQALLAGETAPKKVLEIGTGSSYQTAVLSGLVSEVYSVERLPELFKLAHKRMRQLNCRNVRLKLGDGYLGWPDCGPYDGIIVTAAPPEIPKALLEQLVVGGRMIIPVGGQGAQELQLVRRTQNEYLYDRIEFVSFVPLVRGSQ
jgi:protein-L-isoaspartate(D-aspartate) O-methyltransferase